MTENDIKMIRISKAPSLFQNSTKIPPVGTCSKNCFSSTTRLTRCSLGFLLVWKRCCNCRRLPLTHLTPTCSLPESCSHTEPDSASHTEEMDDRRRIAWHGPENSVTLNLPVEEGTLLAQTVVLQTQTPGGSVLACGSISPNDCTNPQLA